MTATAPHVDLSWLLLSTKRSNTMVHKRVNLRSAMNIGTFRPAVPAVEAARLSFHDCNTTDNKSIEDCLFV